jgi:flagellar biosynthesis/type III secretory pathway protein FliH
LQGVAQGVARGRLEGFAEGVALGRWKGRTEGVIIGAAATGLGVIGAVVHEKRRVRRASAETAPTAMPEEDTTGVPAPEQRTDA